MTLFYSIPFRFFSCWNAHLKFNNRYPPKNHIWKEIHFPRPISFGTSYLCKTFDHLTRFVKIGQQLQENYGIESLSRIVWSLEIGSWDALPSLEPTSPMKTGKMKESSPNHQFSGAMFQGGYFRFLFKRLPILLKLSATLANLEPIEPRKNILLLSFI